MITVRPAHADELAEVGELTVRAYAEGRAMRAAMAEPSPAPRQP